MTLYSPQAIREFYAAVQYLKLFRFDDVYAGIIAYYLGYETQMNQNMYFTRDYSSSWDTKVSEHGYSADEILQTFFTVNPTNQA